MSIEMYQGMGMTKRFLILGGTEDAAQLAAQSVNLPQLDLD
jgi:precorrin-6x reductase